MSPDNFHALYNMGLVELERSKPKEALGYFRRIADRYPRFYPVYYAQAEALRDMGDMRAAMQNVRTADKLVKRYVKNPEKESPGPSRLSRPDEPTPQATDRRKTNERHRGDGPLQPACHRRVCLAHPYSPIMKNQGASPGPRHRGGTRTLLLLLVPCRHSIT